MNEQFEATLQKSPAKGGWNTSSGRGGRGLRHAGARQGARDDRRQTVPELLHGDGRWDHKLPVKADVRKAIGKEAGDSVVVRIDERLET